MQPYSDIMQPFSVVPEQERQHAAFLYAIARLLSGIAGFYKSVRPHAHNHELLPDKWELPDGS